MTFDGKDLLSRIRLSPWLAPVLIAGVYVGLTGLERRFPLRKPVEPKAARHARNLAVAVLSAATVNLVERPLVDRLAAAIERRRWGLLQRVGAPRWIDAVLALALMDYTLYLWHILTHRVPWLWRMHAVHHIDRDLDVSTALRFHFAEMAASVPWRALQVAVLGVGPRPLALWRAATLLSVLFHHSNLRLPIAVERRLSRIIVTPRLHGIHHSIVPEETASNWSSGLTLWDRLHGTLRVDVPQREIVIGVPAFRGCRDVRLASLLKLPFVRQPPAWRLPDGRVPRRPPGRHAADRLAA